MGFDELIGTTQRLGVPMEALAALAAELRAQTEGIEVDPGVRRLLAEVTACLGPDLLDGVPDDAKRMAVGLIRAFFRQAGELVDDPGRPPGWVYEDEVVLQSQGRASMMIAGLIGRIAPRLGDLAERLESRGGAFLDVGTGVGWLAVAMASAYRELRVVGIDTWEPALALAHGNLAGTGMSERIELRAQNVADLDEPEAFDLVWLPAPFLGEEVVAQAMAASHTALRPGGWVVFGLYAGPDDRLASLLMQLRIVRSGGRPWTAGESLALLDRHGFADVHEVERTWQAPLNFVVGRRP